MNNGNLVILNDAIYYPFINLPDDSWLRTAFLFWDTINPIVPEDIYYGMDVNSLLIILESVKAAGHICPEEISQGPKSELFTESILEYAKIFLPNVEYGKESNPYSRIYFIKMPQKLMEELEKMGFLYVNPHDYRWVLLYKPLADIFMGELARFLANDKNMIPITDNDESGKFIFGLPKKQGDEIDAQNIGKVALQFLFEKIIPTPSAQFDIETLLRIKDDNKELLYRFRNSFRTIIEKISEKEKMDEVVGELQKYHDNIQANCLELEEIFSNYDKKISFSDVGAVLSIEKPAKILTTLAPIALGVTASPLFFMALPLFIIYEAARGRQELREGIQKSLRECEGAYIFKIRRDLSQYVDSGI